MALRSKEESSPSGLRQAREAGRAEAEAAELRALLDESLAREQRWMEKALRGEKAIEEVRLSEQQAALWRALCLEDELEKTRAEARRLAAEIATLSAYHRAVESSKGWRLIQFLRGLLGKRW